MNARFHLIVSVLLHALMIFALATAFAVETSLASQPAPTPNQVSPTQSPIPKLEQTPTNSPQPAQQFSGVVPDQDTLTRLQIFLDENGFGPGKIDGHWGNFVFGSDLTKEELAFMERTIRKPSGVRAVTGASG
jgi:hypothetical protein